MEIPKTKDGKHELIFDLASWRSNPLFLNRAVRGRVGYEILKIAKTNPDLSNKMGLEGKARNAAAYDVFKDPLGALNDITFPVEGSVSLDNAVALPSEQWKRLEVQEFRARGLSKPVKYFDLDSSGNFLVNDGDTGNIFYSTSLVGKERRKEIFEAEKRLENETISALVKDDQWVDLMKEYSLYSVLHVLQNATNFIEGENAFLTPVLSDDYSKVYHLPKEFYLQRAKAAKALCEEYLAEMK